MAPEQLEGKEVGCAHRHLCVRAVIYEMATGKRAFEGKSQASLIAAILERDPLPMSSLEPMTPLALDRVVKNVWPRNQRKGGRRPAMSVMN